MLHRIKWTEDTGSKSKGKFCLIYGALDLIFQIHIGVLMLTFRLENDNAYLVLRLFLAAREGSDLHRIIIVVVIENNKSSAGSY